MNCLRHLLYLTALQLILAGCANTNPLAGQYKSADTFTSSKSDGQTREPWWRQVVNAGPFWKATGSRVVVAVIDSGVDIHHPALIGQVVDGYNFGDCMPNRMPECGSGADNRPIDRLGHGTFVAGIIAANKMEGQDFQGLAPGVEIMPIKINRGMMDDFSARSLASAISFAQSHGAKIINISLNMPDPTSAERNLVERSLKQAIDSGIFVVVAIGNQPGEILFPADYRDAIAVAGINKQLNIDSRLSRRDSIVVAAPMDDIESTVLGGGTGKRGSGTSFAAPFVTAALAGMLQIQPDLTLEDAKKILRESAIQISNGAVMFGILNVGKALEMVSKDDQ